MQRISETSPSWFVGLKSCGQPQVVHEEDLAVQALGHRVLDAHRAHAVEVRPAARARCPLPPRLPCAASRRRSCPRRCARRRGCRACPGRSPCRRCAARSTRATRPPRAREAVQVRGVGHRCRSGAWRRARCAAARARRSGARRSPARRASRGSRRPCASSRGDLRHGVGAPGDGVGLRAQASRTRDSPRRRGASGAAGRRRRAAATPRRAPSRRRAGAGSSRPSVGGVGAGGRGRGGASRSVTCSSARVSWTPRESIICGPLASSPP